MSNTNLSQQLVDARTRAYLEAYENLSAAGIVSWFSEDIEFNDVALDEFQMDKKAAIAFFERFCSTIGKLKVRDQAVHGTPEFVTWEMLLSVTYNVHMPSMGIVKGQEAYVRGAVVQHWRWEGGGEWDGDLSPPSKGIEGWKIVKESDYLLPLKLGSKGANMGF